MNPPSTPIDAEARPAMMLRYGLLGLPLSFAALPLVVQWPAHASAQWGLPLSVVGGLLLGIRLLDAAVDPWIGRRADGWFEQAPSGPIAALAVACALLWGGFVWLFLWTPPSTAVTAGASATERGLLLACAAVALLVTTLGYSGAQILHQAWGARLGGGAGQQARWVGAREGFALFVVLCASILPSVGGWLVTTAVLAALLMGSVLLLSSGPTPVAASSHAAPATDFAKAKLVSGDRHRPWRTPAFAWLLGVHLLNGLAAAIPASLVLFFIRDRVQAPAAFEPVFLAAYFIAAAAAVPLWIRSVGRIGLTRTWGAGMVLSLATFCSAVATQAGDTGFFLAICVASGTALGANLVAPPALLAETLRREGLQGQAEGQWFGWWTLVTKLQAAAAAGLALPALQWLGYAPGSRDPAAGQALAWVYAALPCAIQALATALLWARRHEWEPSPPSPGTSSSGSPTP